MGEDGEELVVGGRASYYGLWWGVWFDELRSMCNHPSGSCSHNYLWGSACRRCGEACGKWWRRENPREERADPDYGTEGSVAARDIVMESKYLMTMIAGKLGPRDLRIFSLVCKEWKKIGDEVIGIEEKLRIKRVNQRKDAARYVQFLCCASFWGLYLASVLCSVHFLVPQFVAAIILVLCFLSILTPFHYKKYCTDVVFFHFFTWLYSTAPLVHVITSEAIPYYQKVISCSLSTTLLFRCVFRAVMCRSHIRRKDFKRTMSHAQRSTMIILFSATYFSWTALFSVTYIISEVLLSLWVTIIYKNTLEHWRWLLWPVSTPFRHIQRAQMEVVSGYCCMVLMAFSHAILKNQNNHVVIVSSALLLLFLHKSNSKNWMSPPMFEYLSYDNM